MSDQTNKPVLDQQTFEKLLQAAYVLQEHNRKMRELEETLESQSEQLREQELASQPLQKSNPAADQRSRSDGDYTLTLAQIVEVQHQIQMRHLDLNNAMAVVCERVARITGASGSAIGILEGATVRYRAGAGSAALSVGTEVPLQRAVCQANIRTGQVIRSGDVNTEILFDSEPCLRRGILSLLAVPIYHDGDIVGGLELYFDRIHGFAEQDIHSCQLMAGLVTEAIGRDAESASVIAERSTIMASLETLKPDLAALAEARPAAAPGTNAAATLEFPCWKCGNNLVEEEQFCGKCGAPRTRDGDSSGIQGKIASAYRKQRTNHDTFTAAPLRETAFTKPTIDPDRAIHHAGESGEDAEDNLPEQFSLPASDKSDPLPVPLFPKDSTSDATPSWLSQPQEPEQNIEALSTTLVTPQNEETDVVWSSAAKAKDFLESLSAARQPGAFVRFWRARRGDFYLAIAIILVVAVIRWGVWSNPSVGATGRGVSAYGSSNRSKSPAPDADLSVFDKLLVGLGLAEAPDAPQYRGNPNTQVWIDLHTALYYCPGSDLYGKTPKGKLSSQRDAQLDQFEPANRKACD